MGVEAVRSLEEIAAELEEIRAQLIVITKELQSEPDAPKLQSAAHWTYVATAELGGARHDIQVHLRAAAPKEPA